VLHCVCLPVFGSHVERTNWLEEQLLQVNVGLVVGLLVGEVVIFTQVSVAKASLVTSSYPAAHTEQRILLGEEQVETRQLAGDGGHGIQLKLESGYEP
jgi:hypothetical protein